MADETTTPNTQPADNNTVEQLGEGEKKALDAERRARREVKRQLQAATTRERTI